MDKKTEKGKGALSWDLNELKAAVKNFEAKGVLPEGSGFGIADIFVALMQTHLIFDQDAEARKAYIKALKYLGPKDSVAKLWMDAVRLKEGIGCDKDEKLAAKLFAQLAKQNYVPGICHLAVCYKNGLGIDADIKQAVTLYQQAAAHDYPQALLDLGYLYLDGNGVTKDATKAFQLFKRGADLGDAQAQYALASCYLDGVGVEKDEKLAFKLFEQAANQGYLIAQIELTRCYIKGIGVAKITGSGPWFKTIVAAAKRGDSDARKFIYSHNSIVQRINKFGRASYLGVCYGGAALAMAFLLAGKIENYAALLQQLCETPLEEIHYLRLPEQKDVTTKAKPDAAMLQLQALCEAIMANFNPEIVDAGIEQNAMKTLPLTMPLFASQSRSAVKKPQAVSTLGIFEELKVTSEKKPTVAAKDGRPNSIFGVFTNASLSECFQELGKKFPRAKIGFMIDNSNHSIGVGFYKGKFVFIDFNQLVSDQPDEFLFKYFAEPKEIAAEVLHALSKNDTAILSITPFVDAAEDNKELEREFAAIKKTWEQRSLTQAVAKNAETEQKAPLQLVTDSDQISYLIFAVLYKREDLVKKILEQKAGINQTTKDGATPLYLAVENRSPEIVVALLNAGADPNRADNDGVTPLGLAIEDGSIEIAVALIKSGANPNQLLANGVSLLYFAVEKGYFDVVVALLEAGANPNLATTDEGITPLYLAALNGDKKIVETLLKVVTTPDQVSKIGVSPLYIASIYGHTDIAAVLFQRGADPFCAITGGETPMSVAMDQGRLAILKIFASNKNFAKQVEKYIAAHGLINTLEGFATNERLEFIKLIDAESWRILYNFNIRELLTTLPTREDKKKFLEMLGVSRVLSYYKDRPVRAVIASYQRLDDEIEKLKASTRTTQEITARITRLQELRRELINEAVLSERGFDLKAFEQQKMLKSPVAAQVDISSGIFAKAQVDDQIAKSHEHATEFKSKK